MPRAKKNESHADPERIITVADQLAPQLEIAIRK